MHSCNLRSSTDRDQEDYSLRPVAANISETIRKVTKAKMEWEVAQVVEPSRHEALSLNYSIAKG
jgi:hypothetical protein